MKQLPEILQFVSEGIAKIDWQKEPRGLYDPMVYELSLGGKRLRPALALLGADLFGGELQEVLPVALALEVFHNFTLLHDDVMDHADIRRGKPTVHKKWDANTAILSGDAMSIEAYKLLAQVPEKHLKKILDLFSKMAIEICEGQQYDMDFEQRENVTEEEYLEMIRLKTAVLLGSALQMGSLVGGASDSESRKLYDFGLNIGLAFQLKDDYLDVYGDEKTFGKAIGGDILCNKKTYMLLSALKLATGKTLERLRFFLQKRDFSQEKIDEVTAIYTYLGVDIICREKIEFYHSQALVLLDSIAVPENNKIILRNLTEKLMMRED